MYVPSRAVLQVRAQCCVVTEPCCQVELGNAGDPTLRRQAPAESNFDGITPATHRETKRLCGVSRHVAFAGACLVVVAVSVVLGVLLSLQPSKHREFKSRPPKRREQRLQWRPKNDKRPAK